MADSSVAVTPGTGANIDTFTQAGGDHRQAVVVGDAANAYTATVNSGGALLTTNGGETSASISIAANATSSGSCTGLNGAGTATIQLTGTFVGTVQAQVTVDGSTWVNVTGSNSIVNAATGAYLASGNMTAVGIYQVDAAGMAGVRVITTAYTSGTVTGTVKVGTAESLVGIEGVPAVNVSAINGVTPLMGSGTNGTGAQRVSLATDQAALSVAGVFSVKVDQTTLGTTNAVVPVPIATATAAATVSAQAALTVANVKASAGNVYGVSIANPNASIIYLQFYNTAGTPTLGTSVVWFLAVPASGTLTIPPGAIPMANFATGIGIGASTTATSTGTPGTAPAVTVFYK